ncbi:MAG TPA: hypothetical protein EYM28_11995 [Rhodospirillales bacterium]|nr:hypothetical protein [Rhodospirillales bacterium]|tara:strand:- start:502 stop:729 length:228 start_codon:yes stop_codon:yes gene_type:complete
MNEEKSPVCANCKSENLVFETKHVHYKGVEIHCVKGWHCSCGNAVLAADEAARVQAEYQDSRAFWKAVDHISTGK